MSLCLGVLHTQAAVIAYEGFNYGSENGSLDGSTFNGGIGWGGAWDVLGNTGTPYSSPSPNAYLGETSLIYNNDELLASSGGSAIQSTSGYYYTRHLSTAISDTDGDRTIWLSFLSYTPLSGSGYKIIEFTDTDGTTGEHNLSFGHNNNANVQWQVGPKRYSAGTSSGINISGSSANPNFIVAKIDLSASGDDTVTMYVNPSISSEPTAGSSYSLSGSTTFDRFRFVSYTTGPIGIDEIRLGDTYTDVAPIQTIPEPTTLSLLGGSIASLLMLRGHMACRS